jgi:WD40-like Beta Propeller Repeat
VMAAGGAGASARLNFEAAGLSIKYYAPCVSTDDTNGNDPFVGGGCYVKMPLSLTQLFIATSEKQDIRMTARVLANGAAAPVESQGINLAWANVGLSGGIYYWSTIPNPPKVSMEAAPAQPPTYILLDPAQTNGTAIYRYDFTNGTPAPTVTWTDDGGPKSSPAYQGAPAAVNNNVGKGHCIGCHAISNDGKLMALTIGGSSTTDGANLAVLDIAAQALFNINPGASTDPNSSPTVNFTDYWKKFRVEKIATESTWGPNNDHMVSMYQSKLYLTNVSVSGATGTVTRVGPILPSWTEYGSDPFWSQDGSLFVFTSFDQPDIGNYNTDGLNGDMKRRGKIAIANADPTGIHDDAHDLVARAANVTSFYPCISTDNKLVVFNQSTCSTDPNATDVNKTATDYGNQTCDGYDDSSSTLWIVNPGGGNPIRLDAANGAAGSANSWPRFSPDKGNFRGELIYWVAFSSRRPYGSQVNYNPTSQSATKPQLWIAAVRTGENIVGDPSWGAVWLPTQNPKQAAPQGNHVPQWVKYIVVIEG